LIKKRYFLPTTLSTHTFFDFSGRFQEEISGIDVHVKKKENEKKKYYRQAPTTPPFSFFFLLAFCHCYTLL
jgi:hypothetical protein